MSAADTPRSQTPPLTSRELAAVDGVLKDVKANKSTPDVTVTAAADVGTPPAAFGAGGPMYAYSSTDYAFISDCYVVLVG